ncbi:MAG: hypothetical protein QW751_01980 [Candidatus Aenigmatarchaeota archaeon]
MTSENTFYCSNCQRVLDIEDVIKGFDRNGTTTYGCPHCDGKAE